MNKIFVFIFVSLLVLSPKGVDAQERGRPEGNFDREAFLVKRSAFITAELSLTPQEATVFVPLCEELQQKKYEAGFKCRKLSKEIRSKKNPANIDYTQAMDECLNAGIKEATLEKEYYEKFKKILSPEKLYRYRYAEQKFAREFIRDARRSRD